MCLFFEGSQSGSGNAKSDSQRNEEKTKGDSGGKTEERNFDIVDKQKGVRSEQGGGGSVKGNRSGLEGSGNKGKGNGGTLDKEWGNQVDQQLLVVGSKAQESEFFGEGKKLFYGGQVKAVGLELGKNTVVNGGLKEVEFTNSLDNIVLVKQAEF